MKSDEIDFLSRLNPVDRMFQIERWRIFLKYFCNVYRVYEDYNTSKRESNFRVQRRSIILEKIVSSKIMYIESFVFDMRRFREDYIRKRWFAATELMYRKKKLILMTCEKYNPYISEKSRSKYDF